MNRISQIEVPPLDVKDVSETPEDPGYFEGHDDRQEMTPLLRSLRYEGRGIRFKPFDFRSL